MGAPDLLQHLRSAGFSLGLTPDGRVTVAPAKALTDSDRAEIRAHRDDLAALLADPAECAAPPASFTARRARLVAAGLTDDQAEELASRLEARDRDLDTRTVCAAECRNHRAGRCTQPTRAGIGNPLGALAFLLQHCAGYCARAHQ